MSELSTIVMIALKTSLLLAAAGLAAAALSRASAAQRHLVWSGAIALALVMPFAILYLPANAIVTLPWQEAPAASANAAFAPMSAGDLRAAMSFDDVLLPAIFIVWLAGALILLARIAVAHFGLRRWMKTAEPLTSAAWQATLASVAQTHALPARMTVYESHSIASPCTWGALRPVLLLPGAGEDWPEAERRHAVLHELAHIRRFDYMTTLACRIACAVYWCNPLVWLAAREMKKLQEQACDDAVLGEGVAPSEYAELLVRLAGTASGFVNPAHAAIGMSGRALKHRVLAILNPRNRVQPRALAVLASLAGLSGLMVFIATASAAPSKTPHWIAASAAAAARPLAARSASGEEIDATTAAMLAQPPMQIADNRDGDEDAAGDTDDDSSAADNGSGDSNEDMDSYAQDRDGDDEDSGGDGDDDNNDNDNDNDSDHGSGSDDMATVMPAPATPAAPPAPPAPPAPRAPMNPPSATVATAAPPAPPAPPAPLAPHVRIRMHGDGHNVVVEKTVSHNGRAITERRTIDVQQGTGVIVEQTERVDADGHRHVERHVTHVPVGVAVHMPPMPDVAAITAHAMAEAHAAEVQAQRVARRAEMEARAHAAVAVRQAERQARAEATHAVVQAQREAARAAVIARRAIAQAQADIDAMPVVRVEAVPPVAPVPPVPAVPRAQRRDCSCGGDSN